MIIINALDTATIFIIVSLAMAAIFKTWIILQWQVHNDPQFQEFLQVHKSKVNKMSWSNDELLAIPGNEEVKGHDKRGQGQSRGGSDDQDDDDDDESETSRSDETLPVMAPGKLVLFAID